MGCQATLRPLVLGLQAQILVDSQGELVVAYFRQTDRAVSTARVNIVARVAQALELPLPLIGHCLHVLRRPDSLALGADARRAVDRRL